MALTALTNRFKAPTGDGILRAALRSVAALPANVTNQPDATYDYYLDVEGLAYWSLQFALTCAAGTVTLTVEATCQNDGTAETACTYVDVTNALFGVANAQAAAGAESGLWISDRPLAVKYIHIKVVANTGANTGGWRLDFQGRY